METRTRTTRSLFAILLAIMLMVSLFPTMALAVEDDSLQSMKAVDETTDEIIAEKDNLFPTEEINGGANSLKESVENAIVPQILSNNLASSPISPRSITGGYAVTIDSTGSPIAGSPFNTIEAAVAGCLATDPSGTYTIRASGNDPSMGDVVTIPSGLTITLTSSGGIYTITQVLESVIQNSFRHFRVQGTLILRNVILSGLGGGGSNQNHGGVYVNGGTLTIGENAKIEKCTNRYGGGVYATNATVTLESNASVNTNVSTEGGGIYLNDSVFEMNNASEVASNAISYSGAGVKAFNGSEITMNDTSSVRNNDAGLGSGGGVDLSDSSMIFNSGSVKQNHAGSAAGIDLRANTTLVMNGGEISENVNTFVPHNGGTAAGVYVGSDCTFDLMDGLIANNITDIDAGGVYVHAGAAGTTATFNMYGGAISGNEARGVLTQQSGYGGGVYVVASQDTFNMYGGQISGNKAIGGGGVYCVFGTVNIDTADGTTSEILANEASYGAGLYVNNVSSFSLRKVLIDGNKAAVRGGGIYFREGKSDPLNLFSMESVSITNNEVADGLGGGMCLYQDTNAQSPVATDYNIVDCDFSGNSASEQGGGMLIWHAYSPTGPLVGTTDATYYLTNTTIRNNSSDISGGGIYFYQSSGQADYRILGCAIEQNSAVNGGGVYFDSSDGVGVYSVISSGIISNKASGNGGGLYVDTKSEVSLSDGVITSNTASVYGGGVHVTGSGVFIMEPTLAVAALTANGNPAIYGNEADLTGLSSAGDDLYATGESTSVTLLEASLMPVPVTGTLYWYHDDNNARFRDGNSVGVYTPVSADSSPLALTLGVRYAITYDANGGNGSFSESVLSGTTYTILTPTDASISREGYDFIGWNTRADGSGTSYAPGATIEANDNITLFAQWNERPIDPPAGDPSASGSDPSKSFLAKATDSVEVWIVLMLLLVAAGASLIATSRMHSIKARREK